VWSVELLVLLRGDPGRAWTKARRNAELRGSERVVRTAIAALTQAGGLRPSATPAPGPISRPRRSWTGSPPGWWNSTTGGRWRAEALFSAPAPAIQVFADAFKFGKK
jgi:hypothetical protein